MKKSIWKKAAVIFAAGVLAAFGLSACSGSGSSSSSSASSATSSSSSATSTEDTTIVVGATPSPHAEILEQIKDTLAEEGYTLEIVEYNDYIQPNVALDEGELDANYFQHITYLDDYNAENGTDLVSAAGIHFEPFGIYAGKTASLNELADGATVAVPNDTTNEARALLLLEQEGLITLNSDAGLTATVADIVENPLNLNIEEVEAAQLPLILQDVDIACINGNYALEAGLTVNDAIATESSTSEAAEAYVNVIAVRNGDESSDKIEALVDALTSDEVRQYIEENYEGSVVALF